MCVEPIQNRFHSSGALAERTSREQAGLFAENIALSGRSAHLDQSDQGARMEAITEMEIVGLGVERPVRTDPF